MFVLHQTLQNLFFRVLVFFIDRSSNLFDTSIIFDTSEKILNPMGRPVRRDQLTPEENLVFSRMTQVILEYMLEKYPDPEEHLVLCGEACLDATWPLNKSGVPSIRIFTIILWFLKIKRSVRRR